MIAEAAGRPSCRRPDDDLVGCQTWRLTQATADRMSTAARDAPAQDRRVDPRRGGAGRSWRRRRSHHRDAEPTHRNRAGVSVVDDILDRSIRVLAGKTRARIGGVQATTRPLRLDRSLRTAAVCHANAGGARLAGLSTRGLPILPGGLWTARARRSDTVKSVHTVPCNAYRRDHLH